MERGLFYALGAASPARFAELQRETRLAESLGLAAIWCLPETDAAGEASGATPGGVPAVWLAALAGASQRIRLGWGVPGLWPPQAAPVREAEQAATLDVASAGRLELALLPDSAAHSAAAGDGPPGELADALAEAMAGTQADAMAEGARMLVGMWTGAPFAWESARFAVPEIDVVPKPVQRPHPPLWLAGWKAEQALAAGRAGLGFLDLSGGGEAVWQAHRACYVEARAEAQADALANAGLFAVAVDLQDGSELAAEAQAGRAGPGGRAWLESLEAAGIDAVLLRAGPLEGGHAEACRRIEWLAGA